MTGNIVVCSHKTLHQHLSKTPNHDFSRFCRTTTVLRGIASQEGKTPYYHAGIKPNSEKATIKFKRNKQSPLEPELEAELGRGEKGGRFGWGEGQWEQAGNATSGCARKPAILPPPPFRPYFCLSRASLFLLQSHFLWCQDLEASVLNVSYILQM